MDAGTQGTGDAALRTTGKAKRQDINERYISRDDESGDQAMKVIRRDGRWHARHSAAKSGKQAIMTRSPGDQARWATGTSKERI
jgi:hypothetical protein